MPDNYWPMPYKITLPDIEEPPDMADAERELIPAAPPEPASEETMAAHHAAIQKAWNAIYTQRLTPKKPRNPHNYDPYLDESYDWLTPHPGPTAGYKVDEQAAQQEVDAVVAGRPCVLWVEGRARVGADPWDLDDDGTRVIADRFEADANRLGLTVHRMPYMGEEDVDQLPLRRRWSYRRVPLKTARDVIAAHHGMLVSELMEKLFKEGDAPLTQKALVAARSKTNVLVHRLYREKWITKRYGSDGRLRLFANVLDDHEDPVPASPIVNPGMAANPSGLGAPPVDPRNPTFEALSAGAAYLIEVLRPLTSDGIDDANPDVSAWWRDLFAEALRRAIATGGQ